MWYLNDGYYFWGMHLIWWVVWIFLLVWIFFIPYDIPGQKKAKDTPLEILKKRFAKGEITNEEFNSSKKALE